MIDGSPDGRAALFCHARGQRVRERGLARAIDAVDGDPDNPRGM
jgi:hypothetical protein